MTVEKLYEDEDILAIYKPSGVLVHSDGESAEETIADWFLKEYPDSHDVGEPGQDRHGNAVERAGIVHRLDRETSGTLLLAKTEKGFLHLKKQFQDPSIRKTYHAFVYGEMKEEQGVIDRPIGRSAQDFRLRSAQRGARGALRDAITEFTVLQKGNGYSFLELHPKTGRTHQIRTHLKAINHPVVCDALYAPKRECALGFDRLALHASMIEFENIAGKRVVAEAPLPPSFLKAKTAL